MRPGRAGSPSGADGFEIRTGVSPGLIFSSVSQLVIEEVSREEDESISTRRSSPAAGGPASAPERGAPSSTTLKAMRPTLEGFERQRTPADQYRGLTSLFSDRNGLGWSHLREPRKGRMAGQAPDRPPRRRLRWVGRTLGEQAQGGEEHENPRAGK